jgi:excisionase family DNA binding protein
MNAELTTTQVAERLNTPERTIRLWCKQGRFTGARSVDTPRGNYWLIPESALKGFEKPLRGRTPKPKDESKAEKSVAEKRVRKKDPMRLLKTLS